MGCYYLSEVSHFFGLGIAELKSTVRMTHMRVAEFCYQMDDGSLDIRALPTDQIGAAVFAGLISEAWLWERDRQARQLPVIDVSTGGFSSMGHEALLRFRRADFALLGPSQDLLRHLASASSGTIRESGLDRIRGWSNDNWISDADSELRVKRLWETVVEISDQCEGFLMERAEYIYLFSSDLHASKSYLAALCQQAGTYLREVERLPED